MPSSSKCKQICINILSLCKHQQKTRHFKLKFFWRLNYKSSRKFRGLEHLSSLIWLRVMAIFKLGVIQPRFPFVGVEILTTFWFLWHSFGSRNATKPIKGSKDSDDTLVSNKNLRPNIGSLNWAPGPRKVGNKNAKTTPLVTSPQENPKPKSENIFWVGTRRLAESVKGLNTSLAAVAYELWSKEYRPIHRPARSLKGQQMKSIKNCQILNFFAVWFFPDEEDNNHLNIFVFVFHKFMKFFLILIMAE